MSDQITEQLELDLEDTPCDHEWVDPSNETVKANGYLMCAKCGKLKPPQLVHDYTVGGDING